MTYTYSTRADVKRREEYYAQSAALLDAALRRQDIAAFLDALSVLVKAEGYAAVAQKTGLNRTWLYKAISASANPGIHTIVALLSALGLCLCVKSLAKGSDVHADKDQFMGVIRRARRARVSAVLMSP